MQGERRRGKERGKVTMIKKKTKSENTDIFENKTRGEEASRSEKKRGEGEGKETRGERCV